MTTGTVKLDRFLGRELCVLAWRQNTGNASGCLVILSKVACTAAGRALVVYSQDSCRTRLADQTDRGWRKALYCALSMEISINLSRKVKT